MRGEMGSGCVEGMGRDDRIVTQPSCVHTLGRSSGNARARRGNIWVWVTVGLAHLALAMGVLDQGGGNVHGAANPYPSMRDAPVSAFRIGGLVVSRGGSVTAPSGTTAGGAVGSSDLSPEAARLGNTGGATGLRDPVAIV